MWCEERLKHLFSFSLDKLNRVLYRSNITLERVDYGPKQ